MEVLVGGKFVWVVVAGGAAYEEGTDVTSAAIPYGASSAVRSG